MYDTEWDDIAYYYFLLNLSLHFVQFIAVGVLELLEESLSVLECKIPQYFKVNVGGRGFYIVSKWCEMSRNSNSN